MVNVVSVLLIVGVMFGIVLDWINIMFINIAVGNSCTCNWKLCEMLINFDIENGSIWNIKYIASMLKLCGNDHVVVKFDHWFDILLVIGGYIIGSVGAMVCHYVWV